MTTSPRRGASSRETDLDLYAGDDNLIFPFLEIGGVGGVCVHTHVAGPRVKAMVRAFREGDVETARQIDEELEPVYELLKVQTNPIAIKAALNLLGHDVGGLRLPLVEARRGRDRARPRLSRAARVAQPRRRLASASARARGPSSSRELEQRQLDVPGWQASAP